MIESKKLSEALKKDTNYRRTKRDLLGERIKILNDDVAFQLYIKDLHITPREYRSYYGIISDAYLSFKDPAAMGSRGLLRLIRDQNGLLTFEISPSVANSPRERGYIFRDFAETYLGSTLNSVPEIRNEPFRSIAETFYLYLNNDCHDWLYIHGGIATGKTFLIVAGLNQVIDAKPNTRVGVISFPLLTADLANVIFDKTQPNTFNEVMHAISNLDYLVLDDFGNGVNSAFVRDSILMPILEYRAKNKLVTIFCSRFSPSELIILFSESTKQPQIKNRLLKDLLNISLKKSRIINIGNFPRH